MKLTVCQTVDKGPVYNLVSCLRSKKNGLCWKASEWHLCDWPLINESICWYDLFMIQSAERGASCSWVSPSSLTRAEALFYFTLVWSLPSNSVASVFFFFFLTDLTWCHRSLLGQLLILCMSHVSAWGCNISLVCVSEALRRQQGSFHARLFLGLLFWEGKLNRNEAKSTALHCVIYSVLYRVFTSQQRGHRRLLFWRPSGKHLKESILWWSLNNTTARCRQTQGTKNNNNH